MAQTLTLRAKHDEDPIPLVWRVEVHNRADLELYVRSVQLSGYRTYQFETDNGDILVYSGRNGTVWRNLVGFRY